MVRRAAKGRSLLSLAAVVVVATALLGIPAQAGASRYLPQALEPTLTAPAIDLAGAAGAGDVDRHPAFALLTDTDRQALAAGCAGARAQVFDLFPELAPGSLEAPGWKLASGPSAWWLRPNVWEFQEIASERWWATERYAFVGWAPHVGTDPMGLQCPQCEARVERLNRMTPEEREALDREMAAVLGITADFAASTGHDVWNAASLGTLNRVEAQPDLGPGSGLKNSVGIAADRLANTVTLGAQDNLVVALERTGDVSGVPMAISKTAYDLTPMEEVRVLAQEGDQLTADQKAAAVLTGVSKTAALGALAASFVPGKPVPNPDTVFSGHGGYVPGSGTTTIPSGTSLTLYSSPGGSISDALGNAIELGQVPSSVFSTTHVPGDVVPNYTLFPPGGLRIMGAPETVSSPAQLSSLLRPNMGPCHWAACTANPAIAGTTSTVPAGFRLNLPPSVLENFAGAAITNATVREGRRR